ncbi:methyltransferase domain-containing protein [Phlyctema vagabunda]|uniref:Methyltransferase domain-containing protein n=1 Tax=Phlyctema vagabunda TaxID=108571 RepID=A0ABR4PTW7_9HELO
MAQPTDHSTEENDWSDNDSALGSEGNASSTASLSESVMKYRQENGRSYHRYKDGKYLIPNDEGENDRLDLQHHTFSLTFENKLFLYPTTKETRLQRVLDIGTGTGIWAIDFADEHPESEVLGIDLSPIQPSFIPPNLSFQIDDVEEPWTFNSEFDFIYCRAMTGSIADWAKLFKQSFDHTSQGGFFEVADIAFPIMTDDNSFPPESTLKKWSDLIVEGFAKIGRDLASAINNKGLVEAAGFANVTEVKYKWPLNRWGADPKAKELGMWAHENLSGGIDGISLAVFTRILGWSREEMEVFLIDVRKELKDRRIHSYMQVIVVHGQKL